VDATKAAILYEFKQPLTNGTDEAAEEICLAPLVQRRYEHQSGM